MSFNRNLLRYFVLIVFFLLAALSWQSQASAGQLRLAWTDNANNEDGFTIERKLRDNGNFCVRLLSWELTSLLILIKILPMELRIVTGCEHLTQLVIRLTPQKNVLRPDRLLNGSVSFALALADGIWITVMVRGTGVTWMSVLRSARRGI